MQDLLLLKDNIGSLFTSLFTLMLLSGLVPITLYLVENLR
jgi:hypothetical protein|tara:strand:- start:505 stop:624 length:120 start_codon:yes stop_codon:yes gene_type:complete